MRIGYSEEEDYSGQFSLWQANCQRSINGKLGQKELRELEAALLALPEKRLIHGSLVDDEGGVCAVGAYARHKGLDLSRFDPESDTDEVGIAAGMPPLVAWKVVALNDIELEGAILVKHAGPYRWPSERPTSYMHLTPEIRYEKVLTWVREQLEPQRPRN